MSIFSPKNDYGAGFDTSSFAGNGAQSLPAQQQRDLILLLQQRAAGGMPSSSEAMLSQALAQQQGYNTGQAAAMRGVNPALAMRNSMLTNANMGQQSNQQAAIARMMEQQQAQALLASTLYQTRGQDIANASSYNQLGAGYSGLNAAADRQGSANDASVLGGVLGAAGAIGAGALGGKAKPKNREPDFPSSEPNEGGASDGSSGGSYEAHATYGGQGSQSRVQHLSSGGYATNRKYPHNPEGMADRPAGGIYIPPGSPFPYSTFTGAYAPGQENSPWRSLPEVPIYTDNPDAFHGTYKTGLFGMGSQPDLNNWAPVHRPAPPPVDPNQIQGDAFVTSGRIGGQAFGTAAYPDQAANNAEAMSEGNGGHVMLKDGGQVPGRAQVPGDSPKNDTVPAMLSPGELVVPRSHAHNAQMAKKFIDQIMEAHQSADAPQPTSFGEVLQSHKRLKQKVAQLEKKINKRGA